jgi:colanic acid/amylovoran biosynthesis glycosyltransferase
MLTVAYLANQFPVPVERYVGDEIRELRKHGVRVVAGTIRRPEVAWKADDEGDTISLESIRPLIAIRALGLAIRRWRRLSELLIRVFAHGVESPKLRLKALLHTFLGAYYAVLLREREVDHIHVHHGYFSSWIAIVAARLLGIGFSMTLHGSDLLLHGAYLDTKLRHCRFCITVSDYNRRYILQRYPQIDPKNILVSRLGVDVLSAPVNSAPKRHLFTLLTVGRLHAVKNHAFLIHACTRLQELGVDFECLIAGEGPERPRLERLVLQARLQNHVTLLGHVEPDQLNSLYRSADLFVLTSRSEGLPLVLMEAMATGLLVLAPEITGIPELIVSGQTGFLYHPGNLGHFLAKILSIYALARNGDRCRLGELRQIREHALEKIARDFHRQKNLTAFADLFLRSITPHQWSSPDEDPVLQQV